MKSELYQDKSTKPNDSDIVLADTIRPVINNTRSSLAELTSQRRLQITESRRVENIIYDTTAQLDLEDILIMEAVRLSLNDAT
ncbi:hypothetical protein G6F56_001429 [Rhizopus delemar]|nr:hypothetical protein G6F56_001429 [Rhizopus delemar]